MANDITLKIGVDTGDALSQVSSFNKTVQQAFNSSDKNIQKMGMSLNNVTKEISATVSRMHDMAAIRIDSTEVQQATTVVNDLKNQLEKALLERTRLEATGQTHTQEYTTVTNQVTLLANQLQQAVQYREQMERQHPPKIVDNRQSEEYQRIQNHLDNCVNKAKLMAHAINQATGSVAQLRKFVGTLKSAWDKVSSAVGKVRGNVKNTETAHNMSFKKMLTMALKYVFGIRSIFLAYKKMRTVIKEGMKELASQFPEIASQVNALSNSWWAFKSSLVSAFQPIFSYVVPALVTLINYLTSAMNALANFFALLTNQGFYYKAVKGNKNVAGAVGGTGKAAKDANEELAEYDKLLVIDQDKAGGGGGGGGGGAGDNGFKWEKTQTHANDLADKLKDIWDVFKKAWNAKGKDVIVAATKALNALKSLAKTVGKTFYDVFTGGYGFDWLVSCLGVLEQMLLLIADIATSFENAWKKDNNGYNLLASFFTMLTAINNMLIAIGQSFRNAWNSGIGEQIFVNILHILTNMNNIVTNLANQFTKAWNTAYLGERIFKQLLGIIQVVLQGIEDITGATAEWAKTLNFVPILTAVEKFLGKVKGLVTQVMGVVEVVWTDYVLPFAKNFIEKYGPKIMNILSDVVVAVTPIVEAVKKLLKALAPALNYMQDTTFDSFLATLKAIGVTLGVLGEAISGVIGWLTKLINWTKKHQELVAFFKLMFDINPINMFLTMVKNVIGLVKTIPTIFKAVLNIVKSVFTAILNAIKSIATGIYNKVKFVITQIGKFFKDNAKLIGKYLIDGIVKGIAVAIGGLAGSELFMPFIQKVKDFFGIHSPSTLFADIGKMLIEGLKNGILTAIKNIANWIKTNVVDKITAGFDKIKEKVSKVLDNLFGEGTGSKVIDIATNITSTFLGGLTSLTDFESFKKLWADIKTAFVDIASNIKSKLLGAFTKITDVSTLKSKYVDLKNKWKNMASKLKGTLEGIFKKVTDIDDVKGKFVDLYNKWKDKASTLKAKVGDQIKKITDLTTWKNTFTNLYNDWKDKLATMKAKVGDQIKKIDELVDWKKTFTNLYNSWVGQAADFTVSFLENGKTLTQSAIESWKKKIDGINSWWKGKTATFELKFDAITTDLKSWINTNVFGKIKSVFRKVDIFKKIDLSGLTFGARGGILTSATPLIAGEAGAEALVPLERNLGWLDKMANMISQKLADTSIPLIAQGNILPANSEFMQAINTSVSQTVNNSDIVNVLNSILNRLDAIDNSSNNEPIVLQLDKKVISRAVWDETNKRYKQTGRNNLIIT